MNEQVFHARAGMGRKVQGVALVAKDGFSARYDLDRINGVFSRPEHKRRSWSQGAAVWWHRNSHADMLVPLHGERLQRHACRAPPVAASYARGGS